MVWQETAGFGILQSIMKKTLFAALASAVALVSATAQTSMPIPEIPEAQPPAIVQAPSESASDTAVAAATAATKAVYGMSFSEAWRNGGWIMWVLLAISVFAVMLVIYFAFAFRETTVAPRRLVSSVRDSILEGDDAAARRLCDDRGGAFAAVAATALDCIRATGGDPDGELLRDLVRSEGSRHAEAMQSQAQLLLDLSAIAPMIGLLGTTLGMLQRVLWIERDDFMEVAEKKFQRLAPGKEVRLKNAYIIKCDEEHPCDKDAEGNVTTIYATYDPETRSGQPGADRKIKGKTLHWLCCQHAVPAEVRLYDRLFSIENPSADERDFRELLNPQSLTVLKNCYVEEYLKEKKTGDFLQFQRIGYFTPDLDSTPDHLVFNKTVGLKDTWKR